MHSCKTITVADGATVLHSNQANNYIYHALGQHDHCGTGILTIHTKRTLDYTVPQRCPYCNTTHPVQCCFHCSVDCSIILTYCRTSTLHMLLYRPTNIQCTPRSGQVTLHKSNQHDKAACCSCESTTERPMVALCLCWDGTNMQFDTPPLCLIQYQHSCNTLPDTVVTFQHCAAYSASAKSYLELATATAEVCRPKKAAKMPVLKRLYNLIRCCRAMGS